MVKKQLILKLTAKEDAIVRGTEQATEMVDLMVENWDQIRDKYFGMDMSEQEDMMDHFNSSIENLGDALFGDEANPRDFQQFVGGLEDE